MFDVDKVEIKDNEVQLDPVVDTSKATVGIVELHSGILNVYDTEPKGNVEINILIFTVDQIPSKGNVTLMVKTKDLGIIDRTIDNQINQRKNQKINKIKKDLQEVLKAHFSIQNDASKVTLTQQVREDQKVIDQDIMFVKTKRNFKDQRKNEDRTIR